MEVLLFLGGRRQLQNINALRRTPEKYLLENKLKIKYVRPIFCKSKQVPYEVC